MGKFSENGCRGSVTGLGRCGVLKEGEGVGESRFGKPGELGIGIAIHFLGEALKSRDKSSEECKNCTWRDVSMCQKHVTGSGV